MQLTQQLATLQPILATLLSISRFHLLCWQILDGNMGMHLMQSIQGFRYCRASRCFPLVRVVMSSQWLLYASDAYALTAHVLYLCMLPQMLQMDAEGFAFHLMHTVKLAIRPAQLTTPPDNISIKLTPTVLILHLFLLMLALAKLPVHTRHPSAPRTASAVMVARARTYRWKNVYLCQGWALRSCANDELISHVRAALRTSHITA